MGEDKSEIRILLAELDQIDVREPSGVAEGALPFALIIKKRKTAPRAQLHRFERSTGAPKLVFTGATNGSLGSVQCRIWFPEQLHKDQVSYLASLVLRMRGNLDSGRLQYAWWRIVVRHPHLKTVITGDEMPDMRSVDWEARGLGEARLFRRQLSLGVEPFESMSGGPCAACSGYCFAQFDFVLLIALHHLIADGWSLRAMVDVHFTAFSHITYSRLIDQKASLASYIDLVNWERQYVQSQACHEDLVFCCKSLVGASKSFDPLLCFHVECSERDAVNICVHEWIDCSYDLHTRISDWANQHRGTVHSYMPMARSALVQMWATRTDAEISLAQIWSAVLNVEQVGIHATFLVLGGHSVLGTQFSSRIRKHREIEISQRHISECLTFAMLAMRLEQEKRVHEEVEI